MANTKSTLVTNEDAQPVVFNHVGLSGARMRSIVAKLVNAPATDADTFTICRLMPAWRVLHIWIYNDGMGTSDYNLGLYADSACATLANTTASSESAYADAISLNSARTVSPTDVAYKTRAIEKMGQFVYEDAGHTTSNKLDDYWLGFKQVDAGNAGDVVLNIQFTVD